MKRCDYEQAKALLETIEKNEPIVDTSKRWLRTLVEKWEDYDAIVHPAKGSKP